MKKRVLVGMSGGVDSAVAAHLLLEQGYEVIAGFMKNYADESNPDCHTRQDRDMALRVAQHLGITTCVIFDYRKEYHELIIQYIYNTYKQGLTPNPDILCNTLVKFKLFLDSGVSLGCDAVATGHYARIAKTDHTYTLLKGKDTNKDQSYFLSGLNQQQLAHALFPLGELTKPEVRDIATHIGLPNADRKDSQGLCFIGKVSMKDFLQEALPIQKGHIKNTEGIILGEHDGIWFYTIGQRQGLGLAGGPWYVVAKNTETNELIVGSEVAPELFHTTLHAKNRHRTQGIAPSFPLVTHAKIRYRQTDQVCTVDILSHEKDILLVTFKKQQRAISPGQTIVLYNNDELVGSGIIC